MNLIEHLQIYFILFLYIKVLETFIYNILCIICASDQQRHDFTVI